MNLTVEELIKTLSSYDPNIRVLVEGYEGGFSDILDVRKVNVAFDVHKEDWLGPHEEDPGSEESAVVLFRKPNSLGE